jgi:hypothetical protein
MIGALIAFVKQTNLVYSLKLQMWTHSGSDLGQASLVVNDVNKLSIDDETKLKSFDEEPEAED